MCFSLPLYHGRRKKHQLFLLWRDKQDTQVLIAGINSHICDSCIQQATGIVEAEVEGKDRAEIASQMNLLKPFDIKNHIDQYVIGQDDAKKVLSVAVYNHYKRLIQPTSNDKEEVDIEKSNIIMVGETGTGKHYSPERLQRC